MGRNGMLKGSERGSREFQPSKVFFSTCLLVFEKKKLYMV
uniref:Uncharacterized protein n=1 Tax=Nelumbo nucifera TaxID=4432 RepID=A0A822ZHY5_NELNU|nr:TPA_asm: hypothetical protein HUJ06_003954 [Nelumbo nucifera]